jgi:hypothetical protein
MKAFTCLASAAALAVIVTASAVPAQAAVLVSFTPDSGASDLRWVSSAAGTGGSLFSIAAANDTTAHGVATHFSFLDPSLAALALLPATFTFDAFVKDGNPATASGADVSQGQLSGQFSLIYSGATILNFMGSGIDLFHGANLLSGLFTGASIHGAGGSGAINLANANGGTAVFTSDFEDVSRFVPGTEEFALNLLGVTPGFRLNEAGGLRQFRGNGGGNFSASAAPEPATWGMMILGFGGMGALLRRRRRGLAFA